MQYGVQPDVLSTAKSLGGGFPIGAILTTDKFASALSLGSHGTTYGGNPLATAVAGTVLSIIAEPAFLAEVAKKHEHFIRVLTKLNERLSIFKELRGVGLLIGCELADSHQGKAKAMTNLAAEEGLIALIAGPNVVRFAPALNITQEEMDLGLQRFQVAMERYLQD
jgi:succinylornithine aminotransferase